MAALLQAGLCRLALQACSRDSLRLFYHSDTDCENQRGARMRAAAKHAEEQQCGVEDRLATFLACSTYLPPWPPTLYPLGLVNMKTDDDVETA